MGFIHNPDDPSGWDRFLDSAKLQYVLDLKKQGMTHPHGKPSFEEQTAKAMSEGWDNFLSTLFSYSRQEAGIDGVVVVDAQGQMYHYLCL